MGSERHTKQVVLKKEQRKKLKWRRWKDGELGNNKPEHDKEDRF